MNNFEYYNPTKVLFGKGSIALLNKNISVDKKILLVFGGGSAKSNGVYNQVVEALKGYSVVEFWGIESNPKVATIREAIELGKTADVDFVVAVGGGSVLDATKLIAVGIHSEQDAWEIVRNPKFVVEGLPYASVMTMPATGSEMNKGAVISNQDTNEKFAFYSKYPQFSILDPEVTYTIPPYQVACGIADTFVHVLEQYLTTPYQNLLMDRWAEGILQTLVEIAPLTVENPDDYEVMAHYMLCASLALNGMISMGVTQDWATHMIGHELTAIHGITHAESLTVVMPAMMTVLSQQKREKIIQYGERVWGITGDDLDLCVVNTIAQTESFFKNLGLKTRLSELEIGEATITEIQKRFNDRNFKLGEGQNVTGDIARVVLEECL